MYIPVFRIDTERATGGLLVWCGVTTVTRLSITATYTW